MLFWFRVSLLVLVSVFLSGGAVSAGSAQYKDSYGYKVNNGVSGGYVGSDSWFKSQSRSAAQRQTLQKSMQNKSKKKTGTQSKSKPKAPKQTKQTGTVKSVRQTRQ